MRGFTSQGFAPSSLAPAREAERTITVGAWANRPEGASDGDTLRVIETGAVYVWSSGAARWVLPEAFQLSSLSRLATVVGDNADLTTEGWTHAQNTGSTTTDGTRTSISISGSQSEQWSITGLTAGHAMAVSGYVSFGDVVAAQQQIQVINGTDYCLLSRSSSIGTLPYDWHLRSSATAALREPEYAVELSDDTERWVDIFYDPNSRGQTRVYIDHAPWFGCGSDALQSGGSLSTVSLLVTVSGGGSNSASLSLRQFSVFSGAPS